MRSFISSNREKVEKIISRVEILALILSVLSVLMLSKKISGADTAIITGLSMLAFVYVFHGAAVAELYNLPTLGLFTFALKGSYLALSVTTMGVLFWMLSWHGGAMMLQVGCIGSAIFFLFFIYKLFFTELEEKQRTIINNLIVRMLPALLIAGFFLMLKLRG